MNLSSSELKPGFVHYLDPILLERKGAEWTGPALYRVGTPHFFFISHMDGDKFVLWPLFSRLTTRRRPLEGRRTGHRKWRRGTWHWQVDQAWRAPTLAILVASHLDLSTPNLRNHRQGGQEPGPQDVRGPWQCR